MPQKCVLILLDGLGDRGQACLNGLTPLQAAQTPHLDRLAAAGANGLFHAGRLGEALPSENAHFALFGYPLADFPGRGALEALGAGIDLDPQDVAVLAHLVSLRQQDGALVCAQDRPVLPEEDVAELLGNLGTFHHDGIEIAFHRTKGLFGILRLTGEVSPFVTDTNPMADGRPLSELLAWAAHRNDPTAVRTARSLKAYLLWAHDRLSAHAVNRRRQEHGRLPVNGLVTQRAGRLRPVVPFRERFGLRGATISSGVIYWGLGRYLGLDVRPVSDSDDPGADLAERLQLARRMLADYDFIHVHTKAPDEAGHSKSPQRKKEVIEALDRGLGQAIGPLLDDPDVLVIVTSDHSTPSSGPLIHSGEAVPLLLLGDGVRRDAVSGFDEVSAATGALGCLRGDEFMPTVLNHLDLAKLQGIMDTPEDQPYWPGHYQPFRLE